MSILNSISRGFGGQIGRHAANKVLNGSKQTTDNGAKNYLSFWEGIKTILWFPVMMLVAGVLVYIVDIFVHSNEVLTKGHGHLTLIILFAVVFTLIIGHDYYKNPKYK
jgi:hypothetical protein